MNRPSVGVVASLLLALGVVSPYAAVASAHSVDSSTGILVLAHGGSSQWDRTVRQAVHQARLRQPTELVFGMGMHSHEVAKMQQALERLRRRGIQRLVVIPLPVSSFSKFF